MIKDESVKGFTLGLYQIFNLDFLEERIGISLNSSKAEGKGYEKNILLDFNVKEENFRKLKDFLNKDLSNDIFNIRVVGKRKESYLVFIRYFTRQELFNKNDFEEILNLFTKKQA